MYSQARKAIRYFVCLSNRMPINSRDPAFRTKPCRFFADTGTCTKGNKCTFAHFDEDGNDMHMHFNLISLDTAIGHGAPIQAGCDELHTGVKCYTGLSAREQSMSLSAALERQAAAGRKVREDFRKAFFDRQKVREDLRKAAFELKMREHWDGFRSQAGNTGSSPVAVIGAKRGRQDQRARQRKKWRKASTAASSTVQQLSHTPLSASYSSIGSSNSRSSWNQNHPVPWWNHDPSSSSMV